MSETERPTARKEADRRQATILFADITGFTELGERMEPDELRDAMDTCFHEIERIVTERGGTIDKYIGDCAMALFGAPVALEQAARLAVNSAIEIRNAMQRLCSTGRVPENLDVHIGVNTGLVVAGNVGGANKRDYTVMGSAVNLASRLQNAAIDGEIFVGPNTYRYTRDDFEFKALKPLSVKGVEDPVAAYEVLSREEKVHRARPGTSTVGHGSSMIGRTEELSTVLSALRELAAGEGGIVSIVGENGLGKSRLISEVEQSPEADTVRVLEARSLSTGAGLSYHPFVDLFSHWLVASDGDPAANQKDALKAAVNAVRPENSDEITAAISKMMGLELTGEEKARFAGMTGDALETLIRRCVRSLLSAIASAHPLALIFEDLHWADRTSIDLLESLLPLPDQASICLLLVSRPDYADTSERILCAIDPEQYDRHRSVRLTKLDDKATDDLIDSLLGTDDIPLALRNLVKQRTEGNPFYVEEVIRSLVEQGVFVEERGRMRATTASSTVELPVSIGDVIMARVDRLSPSERNLLQIASTIGRGFDRGMLLRVAENKEEIDSQLNLLVERRFLEPVEGRTATLSAKGEGSDGRSYRFTHALVHDAIYASLLKTRRIELHEACAAAIEEIFSDHLHDAYALLAYHFVRAENDERAAKALIKAGELAAESAASASALQHFRDAYDVYVRRLGTKADPSKKAMLEKHIGIALVNTGNLLESIDHFDSALELYGEKVPQAARGRWTKLTGDLGTLLLRVYSGSLRKHRKANSPQQEDVNECYYNRNRAVHPTSPRRSFFDAIAGIRHLSKLNPDSVDHACGMYAAAGAFFAFAGLSADVGSRLFRVAEDLASSGNPGDRFQLLAMRSVHDFHVGQWDGTGDIDDDLLEEGLKRGLLWDADIYLGMVCERSTRQGRFAESERLLGKVAELQDTYGYEFARSTQLAQTAFLLLERRRFDEARKAMSAYHDSRHEDTLRILALSGHAKLETLAGDTDAAADCLTRADQLVERSGNLPPFYAGMHCTAHAMHEVSLVEKGDSRADPRRAAKSVKRAVRQSDTIKRERVEALDAAARLQAALKKPARAIKYWNEAIETANTLQMAPEHARLNLRILKALDGTNELATFLNGRSIEDCENESAIAFENLALTADRGSIAPGG